MWVWGRGGGDQRGLARSPPHGVVAGQAALRRWVVTGGRAGRPGVPDVLQRRRTGDRRAAAGVPAGVVRRLRRRLGGRIGPADPLRGASGVHRDEVLGGGPEAVV